MIVDKRPELTDELIELYCDWRTHCEEVREKYERFSSARRTERASAYAAFEAALDCEESAAETYATQVRRTCHRGATRDVRSADRSDPILPTGEFPGESRDASSPHR
jgi:hypothetical protein